MSVSSLHTLRKYESLRHAPIFCVGGPMVNYMRWQSQYLRPLQGCETPGALRDVSQGDIKLNDGNARRVKAAGEVVA